MPLYGNIPNRYEFNDEIKEMSFKEIILELDEIDKHLDFSRRVGQEGFTDYLRPIMRGLGNLVVHLLNSFKTNLFKFLKDVKRSELRFLNESRLFDIKLVFDTPYMEFTNTMVPIPSGMVGRYSEVVQATDDCLKIIDMRPRAQCALEWTKDLYNDLRKNKIEDETLTTNLGTELDMILKSKAVLNKKFTAPSRPTKKTSEVFLGMGDIVGVNTKLLDMEHYLNQIPVAYKAVESINQVVDKIIHFIESNDKHGLTKAQIQNLADTIRDMATVFDHFADTMLIQNKVEHNYCQVLIELISKAKMVQSSKK